MQTKTISTEETDLAGGSRPQALTIVLALTVALAWSYWPVLEEMARRWSQDQDYSHGFLVPFFSLALLGMNWDRLGNRRLSYSPYGLVFLAVGLGLNVLAQAIYFDWLSGISFIPCLVGIVLLAGGWPLLGWSWSAIAYLVFMVPLPFRVETALAGPLQSLATSVSTYVMQTIGLPAVAEGNVILVHEVRIGIVEACSGLRMLMVFFALATAVALVVQRLWWERAMILLAAAPIAIIVNVTRVTVTGSLYAMDMPQWADAVFHDLAGWLMMPMALLLLAFVDWYIKRLFVAQASIPLPLDAMRQ